ncbi:mechanosensitive ion channel family protein [Rubrivirga sp. S365]|uniref:mechanosensitive ion channel family protein n=1 Tax=Rubrivirga sp. S365 TaxID=3076080 RepID=UPI0028C9F675|nr:mechanosensitive ion channel family protein [Rubrivirga sp. S365]MDT7857024.1 mechanosensitive ion channel family protein [Rubrivirga sp. S365]
MSPLQVPDTLAAADTLFEGAVAVDSVITAADLAPTDTAAVTAADATGEAVGQVQEMINGVVEALPRVAVALVVFALIWLLASGVRRLIHRATPGPRNSNIGIVLGRLAYAVLLVIGVLVGLVIVFPTFTFGSLIGALGIGGVALGFAFQDIFQNLLAGILLLLREPFRQGDEITSGEYTGVVEAIETRATFISTYDGRRVIIPNSQIYSDPVQVITAYDMLRSEYDVGIGYGDDIEEAKRIALAAVQGVEGVLADPGPDVLTWDLAGSSVNLRVRWWSQPKRSSVVVIRDRVLVQVSRALLAAGIDLPFPTQQILFHDQTEETDGDRTRQREGWPAPKGGSAPDPARIGLAIAAAGGDGVDDDRSAPDGAGGADDTPPAVA